MSRLPIAAAASVLVCAACALESHTITPLVEAPITFGTITAPTSTPPHKPTPQEVAKAFDSPVACLNVSTEMHVMNPDRGFALLAACITARDDFTLLAALLDTPWLEEMRFRPEAASLITRVIANRGGNIDHDLRVCRRAGLHLHTLRAALADPDELAGALIVMRGSIVDARRAHGTRAVELSEMRPATNDDVVESDELFRKSRHIDRTDLSIETGLTLVARLPDDAAVLEPQLDYIVLLRFEGEHDAIRPGDPIDRRASLATIIDSYEAGSLLER